MSTIDFERYIHRLGEAFAEDDPAVAAKAEEEANVRRLQAQIQALAQGDVAAFRDSVTDDIEFEVVGPPDVPFLGRWRGRDEVARAVAHNFSLLEQQQSEVQSVVAQGAVVVLVGREKGRYRADQREYDLSYVQVHTFRNGRTARIREYVSGPEPA